MGVGEGDDRDGKEKDGKRDRSRRKKRDRDGREKDGREKDRETESGRGREIGVGETGSGRERERGEREKITNTNKFMELYLVVLHSAERSEARQVSCYNLLSCFNPVTRDKVGKKKIERETGWEREKNITRGDRNL